MGDTNQDHLSAIPARGPRWGEQRYYEAYIH